MDDPNINGKLISLFDDGRKGSDPSSLERLCLGSCGIHVLHGAYTTGVKFPIRI